jgi:salicylate hydroxylase
MERRSSGSEDRPRVVVSGGGIGGLALATALRASGVPVTVLEQASRYTAVGDALNCTPNSVKVLDRLGMGALVRERGFQPRVRLNRDWRSGEVTSRIEFGSALEERYGAPLLTLRRSELVEAFAERVPSSSIVLGAKVVEVRQDEAGVTAVLSDGTEVVGDVLIGADGVHSTVRRAIVAEAEPVFTGILGYRTLVDIGRVSQVLDEDERSGYVKWWGPDRTSQIVTYPAGSTGEFYLFAAHAESDWREESWSAPGDPEVMRAAFTGYEPRARALLDLVDEVLRTALHDRDPLPRWTDGRMTLLGDACHPMTPFMAQGAAQAIEDAFVLASHLAAASVDGVEDALLAYEAVRRPRTDRVQRESHANEFLKDRGDPSWLYGHDVTAMAA